MLIQCWVIILVTVNRLFSQICSKVHIASLDYRVRQTGLASEFSKLSPVSIKIGEKNNWNFLWLQLNHSQWGWSFKNEYQMIIRKKNTPYRNNFRPTRIMLKSTLVLILFLFNSADLTSPLTDAVSWQAVVRKKTTQTGHTFLHYMFLWFYIHCF